MNLSLWKKKVAVVTGASSGIGKEISIQLVKNGLTVIGLSRRLPLLEGIQQELNNEPGEFYPYKCDITNELEVQATFNWIEVKFKKVHLLVNNAGLVIKSSLIDGDSKDWLSVLHTNTFAPAIVARAAIKLMTDEALPGLIININSIAGHAIYPDAAAISAMYFPSKYGLTAFSLALRSELVRRESKIRVTSLSPGPTDTEIVQKAGFDENAIELRVTLQPIDIANAVLYLLSTPIHVNISELTIEPVYTNAIPK